MKNQEMMQTNLHKLHLSPHYIGFVGLHVDYSFQEVSAGLHREEVLACPKVFIKNQYKNGLKKETLK